MTKKYDKEYIKNLLEEKGYEILGEIKSANDKVLCRTKEGYKVLVSPMGIIRRGDVSDIFSKFNPYTIENINLWIENHGYTCELLSSEYINSKGKLEFKCECGTHYYATTGDLLQGKRYCNYCAKSKRYDSYKDYNKLVADKCAELGYTLLPNQNIARSNTEFYYVCNKHKERGIQHSNPSNFVTDSGTGGCYWCGVEKRSLHKRKDDSYFREITERAGMIYRGVDRPDNGRAKIMYQCPKHMDKGVLTLSITNMKRNKGNCPYCMGKYRTKEDLQSEIDNMKLYVDILEYSDYSSPMRVRCRICGNEWTTTGASLTQGVRCPECSMSGFEVLVMDALKSHNIEYIYQYKYEDCINKQPLPFDFYLPEYNALIEADGEGHYFPIKWSSNMSDIDAEKSLEETQFRDNIKTEYCKEHNISLIRIPYWERDNVESVILDALNKVHNN